MSDRLRTLDPVRFAALHLMVVLVNERDYSFHELQLLIDEAWEEAHEAALRNG